MPKSKHADWLEVAGDIWFELFRNANVVALAALVLFNEAEFRGQDFADRRTHPASNFAQTE